ncbi:MAG: undecaprenyldiphospho-muramoylpentapeptide beta-N-acetylglucosaminyltransferase [Saprospiraceae bacterium]
MKIIISGGGTGGHIFPAIAIADAFKELHPEVEILFVGAESKLEMTAVPAAGYKIIGLDIGGFQRKFTWKNLLLVLRLMKSLVQSNKIISQFKPDAVLGVGGYASGPVMKVASWKKIPLFIQEQNSYAGVTNKLLASKVSKIFVAFEGMNKFFPKAELQLSGNPVRECFVHSVSKIDAYQYFGLDETKKTIAVCGGSLGAKTLNEVVLSKYEDIQRFENIQLIVQVGKSYWKGIKSHPICNLKHVVMLPFIDRMEYVYAISDVAITRAGAITLSELAVTETVAMLVPSPNVAEDHQRKNAESMVAEHAACMILDVDAKDKLWSATMSLLENENKQKEIKENLKRIRKPNAANEIANEIINIISK